MKSQSDRPGNLRKKSAGPETGWTAGQRQKIAELAYRHFLARGCQHGYHVEDWLQAEAELAPSFAPSRPRRAVRDKAAPK
jgi:hypothetical protein